MKNNSFPKKSSILPPGSLEVFSLYSPIKRKLRLPGSIFVLVFESPRDNPWGKKTIKNKQIVTVDKLKVRSAGPVIK